MSHYTVLNTQFVDVETLVKALSDVGFSHVEVHDHPQILMDWVGLPRPQKAEVIIRRKYVGRASNDIGFRRQKDGTFQAIISKFDRIRHSENWLQSVARRYAYHATLVTLTRQGFELAEESENHDQFHLTLRRVA
ncbi:MAG: DUF1257 domain-containing protein [Anaerolineae bacterium]|nr:DUF1257 domain-containing protein [Anaerolineae bacterium]